MSEKSKEHSHRFYHVIHYKNGASKLMYGDDPEIAQHPFESLGDWQKRLWEKGIVMIRFATGSDIQRLQNNS